MNQNNLLLKILLSNSKAHNTLSSDQKFMSLINNLDNKSIVLDIGANLGNVSNFILEKKNCTIIAFEPNELCYQILNRRFTDDKRIQIFNFAISNFSGISNLYLHKKSKGISDPSYMESSSIIKYKDNVSENNFSKINVMNITNILSKFKKIDLIKIDVEGSEYEIIPVLIQNKSKIRSVLCELHGNPNKRTDTNRVKNKEFTLQYEKLIKLLKEKKLYNNWFYEWY